MKKLNRDTPLLSCLQQNRLPRYTWLDRHGRLNVKLFLLLCCEPFSLAAVDLVLVDPAPKGAIGDTDLTGDPGDRMLLIGSSNQPNSFSAKFRRVGRVCSWQCSPFRALFSVLNSPRNRRKSSFSLTQEVGLGAAGKKQPYQCWSGKGQTPQDGAHYRHVCIK